MNSLRPAPLALAVLCAIAALPAVSRDMVLTNRTASAANAWTEADYGRARMFQPQVGSLPARVFDLNAAAAEADAPVKSAHRGQRGGADASHLRERRVLRDATVSQADDLAIAPAAVGAGSLYFTSSQAGPQAVDTTYPYRAIGKLFFRAGAATYMCTGTMIKPGVVVTAGHCVHNGSGSATGWYTGFQFIPGYRRVGTVETRPYGTWSNWSQVRTSGEWYLGGGRVPNAGDFALIVFNKDASGRNIGNYTGWLGAIVPRMIGRHQTVLGYPGNLDGGGVLHRVDSMITDYGAYGNGVWGSDMEGGSSGGPAVENFQMSYANTSAAPLENEANMVSAVVSWGYVSSSPKVQGGTQFNANFGAMLSGACTAVPGAC